MVADQNQATAGRGTNRTTTGVNGTAWVTHTVGLTPRRVGYVGQTTNGTTGATLAVSAPAGAVGDFLLAQFAFSGGSNTIISSAPAGWTLLNRTNRQTSIGQVVYWRVADGTTADNAALAVSVSGRISGGILRYAGVDTSAPPIYVTRNATSTTLTANAVTTTVVNSRVVAVYGINSATTLNYPTSTTGRYRIPGPAERARHHGGRRAQGGGRLGRRQIDHGERENRVRDAPDRARRPTPSLQQRPRCPRRPAARSCGRLRFRRRSRVPRPTTPTAPAWRPIPPPSHCAIRPVSTGTDRPGRRRSRIWRRPTAPPPSRRATTWTSSATLPAWNSQSDGIYTVQATATDKAGNSFTGPSISFTLDNSAPTTASVTTPADGAGFRGATVPPTFSGTAADNAGGTGLAADSTTFTLRDAGGRYWNGLIWQALPATLSTTNGATVGDTSVTWTSAMTPPAWADQPDGVYTVQATAVDRAGNLLAGPAVSFSLDNSAPIVAAVNVPTDGGLYRSATLPTAFSGAAADNTGGSGLAADSATFTLRGPNGDYWTGSVWQATAVDLATAHGATSADGLAAWTSAATLPNWSGQPDGTYTVQATANDKAGNDFTGAAVDFALDSTPPTAGTITIDGGAATTNDTDVTLSLSATDAASGVTGMQFSDDGLAFAAPVPYATSADYTLPAPDGQKTVYVRFIDAAGNVSLAYSATILLDTNPPSGTITINGGATYATNATVTLGLSASSDAAEMQFSDDGVTYAAPVPFANSVQYALPGGDGLKRVYVKFIDGAGNVSTPVSSAITLDTAAPTGGTIVINGGAPRTNSLTVSLALSASDATSGMAQMRFSNDDVSYGTPAAYATTAAYSLPGGDGPKRVYVKYVDRAGNESAPEFAAIVLDTTGPAITAPDLPVKATGVKTPVTLSASATDTEPLSPTVTYWIGATPTQIFSGHTFGLGATTVTARATDAAGNTTAKPFVVTVARRVVDVTAVADTRAYSGSTTSALAPSVIGDGAAPGDAVTYAQSFADKHVGSGKVLTPTVTIVSGGTSFSGPWPAYYDVTLHTGSGAITPAALSITATSETKPYDGDTSSAGTASVAGLKAGDTVTGLDQSFVSKNVLGTGASTLRVTAYAVNDGNAGGNYTVTTNDAPGTITPIPLDIDAVTDTRVYDGTTASAVAPDADPTGTQLQGGDDFTVLFQSFASKNVLGTNRSTIVVTYTLDDDNSGHNYVVTTRTATGTISVRHVTGTFTAADKPYDGNTSATVLTRGLVGAVGGDDIRLSGGTAKFNNKNVGVDKPVTLTSATLAGTEAGNYTLDSVAATTATILAPWHLSGTFTAADKVYDGTTAATVTGRGLVGVRVGDDVSLSGGTATFSSRHVGAGKVVTLTGYSLAGTDAINYVLDSVNTTTASITPATLDISAVGDSKVYDGTTMSGGAPTVVGLRSGDTVTGRMQEFTSADVLGANGSTLEVSEGYVVNDGNFGGNYAVVEHTATGTISPKSITGAFTAAGKVYDATVAATVTGRSLAGVIGVDVVGLSGGTATFDTRNVGAGKPVTLAGATLAGTDAGNYTLGSLATTTASISAAPLTITAVSDTKPYDGTTTSVGAPTVSGLKGSDTVTGRTQAFVSKSVLGAGGSILQVATYTVNDGNAGGNYAVTVNAAVGTITAKGITITGVTAADKVYDGGTTATAGFGGAGLVVVSGDVVSINSTASGATFATKTVGLGKTVTLSGVILSGADAGNYSLTQPGTTASITAKGLTVTGVTAADKVYDGTTTATLDVAAAGLHGKVSGDAVTLASAGAAGVFVDKNVGAGKTVTVSGLAIGGADAGNYTVTQPTATASITARSLTVTATGQNKTYDGTPDATVTLASNKLGGDTVALSYASAAFADGNAGTDKPVAVSGIAIGGADADNYALLSSAASTTASIAEAGVTVDFTAADKAYDGTTEATITGASLGGVIGSDIVGVDLSAAAASFEDKDAGSHAVSGSGFALAGADRSNYSIDMVRDATATIDKAVLTVEVWAAYKVRGEPDPSYDYDLTGFVKSEDVVTAGVAGTPVFSRELGENLGSYELAMTDIGTLDARNYRFEAGPHRLSTSVSAPTSSRRTAARL